MPDDAALTQEETEALEAEAEKYYNYPVAPIVSRSGWKGAMSMGVSAAKMFGIPWDDKQVQLMANCLVNYENFKRENL